MSTQNILNLAQAISQNTSYDAFAPSYSESEWATVGTYMQGADVNAGVVLIEKDTRDRTLFFLESGAVSVHLTDVRGQMRLAILNPGSVIGEGSFFSRQPRSANVVATGACRIWRLAPTRYAELSSRHANLAVILVMELGAVIAKRMVNSAKRIAVT
ncbi:MAG: cyclic nucleotide-binding domain-containing protein [Variovorax sp.]